MSFFGELWEGEEGGREWTIHFLRDLYMTLCIMAGVSIFFEVLAFLRFQQYPPEKLASFEEIHFHIVQAALIVLGAFFILKLAISLWPRKKKKTEKTASSKR